ncbi:MAG: Stk1 family PASTA domain-containing Ser/Thr kinase [Lachnospiraceae bacterium]|nr:Stk1 family PASTA domain-containing Ser/Thr kinase [Lachnospiraceae bacterium]
MIKSGTIIGDRYEVLEKIGTGGMSDVYKAKDQKLNRFVAIKVLKQEFSENRNFVSKFRVEAQAAAGLMHPNIVNVYDVGEEDGIHYIVMELVEGITLKKYIEKKSRLSTKEAISIAIQVSMGMEAAHNNHIIHRDIKPQNIIISKEGKVKVTDFGIAKAASSNTITSNVMGSVHYTSPEQARGGFSDEKSDIYSLGITMFEMLAGRVPFNGDTTVSIAIKHIQDEMPDIREFVPDIPISVENIVKKCTQKSPDRRYQCMADIIKDLKHSLINPDDVIAQPDVQEEIGKTRIIPGGASASNEPTRQPRREEYAQESDLEMIPNKIAPQKRPVSPPMNMHTVDDPYRDEYDEPQAVRTSSAKRQVGKSSAGASGQKAPVKKAPNKNTGGRSNQSKSGKNASNKGASSGKNSSKKNRQKYDDYYEKTGYTQEIVTRQNLRKNDYEEDRAYLNGKDEYDYNPKAEGFTTVLTVLGAIIVGCILLYFAGQATGIFDEINSMSGTHADNTQDSERAVMPEFVGHNVEEVKKAVNDAGLGCKPVYVESTQYEKNIVISAALEDGQTVLANDKILMNTTIVLTVSAGADGVKVQGVEGMSEAEGTAALTNQGFKVVKREENSAEYAKGTIISQSPEANSMAPIGSEVTIVISAGGSDKDVIMPKVTGFSSDAATSNLEAAGLVIGNIDEAYSAEFPEGQICYQSYAEGTTVKEGTVVDLKVSIGSEKVTYNCSLMIQAPADYMGGNAEVILTTADGSTQLWYSQNVTSFPVAINLNDFESPTAYGIVTISYLKQVQEVVLDAEGKETTQMGVDVAQIHQNVQFTQN